MQEEMKAIEYIFMAPLWPRKEDIPMKALPLYDDMLASAKSYALNIAREEFEKAFQTISRWSRHVSLIFKEYLISESTPLRQLMQVFIYYCDLITDWGKIRE